MSEHRRIIYALIIYAWLLEKAILKKSTVNKCQEALVLVLLKVTYQQWGMGKHVTLFLALSFTR